MADTLTEIVRAAGKHPNSRVSKLVNTVGEDPTQKNIVLLLIEIAEHAEYSIDFSISLKYYLDLFERLGIGHDLILNEAGLLLVNSSKIYSKRVDYVQSLVERQILTLSNADDEIQKEKLDQPQAESTTAVEKPKRGRKRALEAVNDRYEVEMAPKKFKKLSEEKRFAAPKVVLKAKSILRNIEMEQYIHPAAWQHAIISDFENEEDVDTKRNYKLFTYHVEHRYNTLVPDINFRLHFKVKDYMDEQEEMEEYKTCNTDRTWPPLSEAYVQKYLSLENYILEQDVRVCNKKTAEQVEGMADSRNQQTDSINFSLVSTEKGQTNLNSSDINGSINDGTILGMEHSILDSSVINTSSNLESSLGYKTHAGLENSNVHGNNDSGLGESMSLINNTLENTQFNSTLETSTTPDNLSDSTLEDACKLSRTTTDQTENDSALGTSILESSNRTENNTTENVGITSNKENLTDSNLSESNTSLNGAENQSENDSTLISDVLDKTGNIDTDAINQGLDTTKENSSEITNSTVEEEVGKSVEDSIISTENIKDSALNNGDHHHSSISPEGVILSTENGNKTEEESGTNLNIDVASQQDKNASQLRVNLPHADDEGVYLSDLDDCRLLSPVINAPNILPGVDRKDVTIFMDEELRQALEMRDGIMEHFGYETYKVPIITEEKQEKLIFNILQLPQKLLRRKALFKLGPDMNLFVQSRRLKRHRPEVFSRTHRNTPLLQYISLNNADKKNVNMTSPNNLENCTEFYGFTDDDDDDDHHGYLNDNYDDSISCDEFYGFTEEEQIMLMVKQISRLSRDSGVGVDTTNLTPEKEIFEIMLEDEDCLDIEGFAKNMNLSGRQDMENILSQLPAQIRDVLMAELEEYNNSTKSNENDETTTKGENELNEALVENKENSTNPLSSEFSEAPTSNEESSAANLQDHNTPNEPLMSSEGGVENSESVNIKNCSLNKIQELNVVSTEKLGEICDEQNAVNSNIDLINKSQNKPSSIEVDTDSSNNTNAIDMFSSIEQTQRSSAELLNESVDLLCTTEINDTFLDQGSDDEVENIIFDSHYQHDKTKIQQWHEHLQPILAKSRERHHFDIYKLGTEIIETVKSRNSATEEPSNELKSTSHSPVKQVATFHDIMDGKDESYVSRYFLSTLLLANQSNIEISIHNKSSEKPSSWRDIDLILLSTKRHTVAIEDNIGMIKNRQEAKDRHSVQNSKNVEQDEIEDEDEPLIKKQNIKNFTKLKTSLKRSSHNAISSCIAEKKSKEISTSTFTTNSRHKTLIQSVQIITPPSNIDSLALPSTSRQAQKINAASFNVNINAVRTLQPIEKVQKRNDDHDSGIFSIDENSTS